MGAAFAICVGLFIVFAIDKDGGFDALFGVCFKVDGADSDVKHFAPAHV